MLRYIKGTLNYGIVLDRNKTGHGLVRYRDATHQDNKDRHPTCGYLFLPISWRAYLVVLKETRHSYSLYNPSRICGYEGVLARPNMRVVLRTEAADTVS